MVVPRLAKVFSIADAKANFSATVDSRLYARSFGAV
jgi:hypothetical protein